MSQTKFAEITSGLLARKGDATPSAVLLKTPSLFWWRALAAAETPGAQPTKSARAARPSEPGKPHKFSVTLSAEEYEKLGIAAVKKGVSRQAMMRRALELHLEQLQREFSACACMASGGPCREGCLIF